MNNRLPNIQPEEFINIFNKNKPTKEENISMQKAGNLFNSNSPCNMCSNNPKNGGSGICHCVLGLPKIT